MKGRKMAILKIEEMLGKEPEEVAFRDDSNNMIKVMASLSSDLEALPGSNHKRREFYREMEKHYRALAAIDGVKDTFTKMADYFAEQSKKI